MRKRLTYEFVKEQFEKKGYELLSEDYVSAHLKLKYKCPKGHIHNICWGNWQQGQRCPYCTNVGRPTINFIRSEFEKEEYELLSTEYINAHTKLKYGCPKWHEHSTTWNNWKNGYRCPYCYEECKPTIEFIRSDFAKEGYQLLTKEYINNKQKLDYICPNGRRCSIVWNSWKCGSRCSCCDRRKIPIKYIEDQFKKEGWILESTKYVNARQKLDCICPNGHKHSIRWHSWQSGNRCPYCAIIASKGEIEVREFVKSLNIEILANDRNQIFNPETGNGFELDIFMPKFNKAIEYNGEYWHGDRTRDLFKQQLCGLKEIDLLIVWENEWKTQNNACKNRIKEFVFNSERGV